MPRVCKICAYPDQAAVKAAFAIAIASLGVVVQAAKLEKIETRLERMNGSAEAIGSSAGVAALSAQALRSIEVGSRLAGTGGCAAPRAVDQPGAGPTFSRLNCFPGRWQK
jgi:hypothetical protein